MAIKILSPSAKYKVYSRSTKECLTVPDGINSLPISLLGGFNALFNLHKGQMVSLT